MLIENIGLTIHDRNIDDSNVTPLHVVSRACDGKDCVTKSHMAIFIIDSGADVDAIDSKNYTSLHYAAQTGKLTSNDCRLIDN